MGKDGIATHNRQILDASLCDEKSVEWIAVMIRKLRLFVGMIHRDRENL